MKKSIMQFRILIISLTLFFSSCIIHEPFYNPDETGISKKEALLEDVNTVLYLIGDAGAADTTGADMTLNTLARRIKTLPEDKSSVVFLGDNIYTEGMHAKHHVERPIDEAKIKAQLDVVLNFGGQVAFIPGNHDWHKGHSDGLKYLRRQEKFIEDYLNENVFYPSEGCPGPELINLGDNIALIIIDTQWWLQKEGKPIGVTADCEVTNDEEFILAIRDMLDDNAQKQIVVAGHHPMYSNGEHGGYFRFQDHLFPLTKVWNKGYIPLPGLGSIYPLYRKFIGNIQDIPHERYTALVKLLEAEFIAYPGLIYTSGHDHNLQLSQHERITHILSGGGSKATWVRKNKNIIFGASEKGFARVIEFNNGDILTEFIIPSDTNPDGDVVFSKKVSKVPEKIPPIVVNENYVHDENIYPRVANIDYKAGKTKEFWLGKNYRDVWTDTIYVPVINLDSIQGGINAIQKGGGMQTLSIRYEGENGIQYVSRSINKFPNRLLPPELRATIVGDILKDGIASSHPYSFLTVPPLADAVGVYHTNPKLGILPDSPRLGQWREDFAGMLVLFEERPAHDQEHNPSFGNSEKVQSSAKVIEKLRESHDITVDPIAMLRARLFDMFLADWDRHDDQWRWARFKKGGKTIYKPIPRDRDQVFFKQDGVLPYLSSRTWAQRRFQSFKPEIRDIHGENMNAQWIDRDYLTSLSLENWIAIADSMQMELTNEIIEMSIKRLPESAYRHTGEYTVETLKARRDNLKKFAEEYYYILAKQVNITGSADDEYFNIKYNKDEVRIRMYNRKSNHEKGELLYDRTFKTAETDELDIYGIGGNDDYDIEGDADGCKIKARLIGGPEEDKYRLNYNGKGLKKNLDIYEFGKNDFKKSQIKNANKLYVKTVDDVAKHHTYDRNEFKYDAYLPLITPGYNADDGIFLGGGVVLTKHGFKRYPYKSKQRIYGSIAQTGTVFANYHLDARQILGELDAVVDFTAQLPNLTFSFYGVGNDQEEIVGDWREFQMRVDQMSVTTYVKKSSDYNRMQVMYGSNVTWFHPQDNTLQEQRFPEFINQMTLDNRFYVGGDFIFKYVNTDHPIAPIRGIALQSQFKHNHDITNKNFDFDKNILTYRQELRLYFPLTFIPIRHTFALRGVYTQNLNNNAPFYYLNYIGGIEEMRGFRRNRLAGNTSFYTNIDFRVKLFQYNNHLLPMEIGLIGFTDVGRVWSENDASTDWYKNFGGGIYFYPVKMFLLNVTYGYSKLDKGLVTARAGFQF